MNLAGKMTEYLDSSILVKWFKKNEEKADEAKQIYQNIKDFKKEFTTSEWTILEVTRALVKSGHRLCRNPCVEVL